jgi:CubicO group peptidase (beta-lactamase class C family)
MPLRPGFTSAVTAAVLLLACARSGFAADTGPSVNDAKDLEAFADQFFQEKLAERHVPGAVFVVVKDGRIVFAKGFGYAERERQTPVIPDKTTFRVASVSKLFTATAVMQLVEQGRLSLNEDVNHYLKSFQLREPFPRPVTLANLLTHTGGFDERTIGTSARTRADIQPLGAYLAARMPACAVPPGDVISYSNHGVSLAGYIVEETSGVPFARYVAEHILEPLGMRRSSFAPDDELERDLAVAYDYDKEDGSYKPIPVHYINGWPAGSLVSTGTDMAAFLIAHLQDGRYRETQILQRSTAREMHRQHFTQHPRLPGVAYGFWERFENGRRTLEHSGDLSGFASLLCLLPDEGVGFFVSCNHDDLKLRDDLVKAFLDHYYPARKSAPFPAAPADFARRAGLFTGYYQYNRYSRNTIEKAASAVEQLRVLDGGDGTLVIEVPSFLRDVLSDIRLVEVEPLLFRRDDGDRYAAFRMDADGRITHLTLNVLGAVIVLEKVPWFDSVPVQAGLTLGFIAVFLCALLALPVAALVRRLRRRPRAAGARRLVAWLAWLIGFLNLAFVGGLVALLLVGDADYGMPPAAVALFVVPFVSAALTGALLACSVRSWRGCSFFGRTCVAVFAVASVGFLVYLNSGNLLGFRF